MSAALFSSDGLVNDIQREFWGPEATTRWADRQTVGDNVVTTKFLEVKDHYGDFIVSAVVDGDYDKTGLPELLVPTFSFSLAADGISRLIILGNKPGARDQWPQRSSPTAPIMPIPRMPPVRRSQTPG